MSLGGYSPQRVETCPLCREEIDRYLARHLEEDCPETGSVSIEEMVDGEGSA